MKNRKGKIVTALMVLTSGALVGCGGRGQINANAFGGVLDPVLDRHDAYVEGDANATQLEKDTWLRSSQMLRSTVDIARGVEPSE